MIELTIKIIGKLVYDYINVRGFENLPSQDHTRTSVSNPLKNPGYGPDITSKSCESDKNQRQRVLDTTHDKYEKWLVTCRGSVVFPGTLVSFTDKTNRSRNIAEILLKVAENTHTIVITLHAYHFSIKFIRKCLFLYHRLNISSHIGRLMLSFVAAIISLPPLMKSTKVVGDRMVVGFTVPMQSVPITTDVVSSNLDQGEVSNIM